MDRCSLIAVDVGNARIKLGLFAPACAGASGEHCRPALPEPVQTLSLDGDSSELDEIATWLGGEAGQRCAWCIASVNRPAATRLIDWLHERRPDEQVTLLAPGDLPLVVRLERPDIVGVDRLVDAVAVNRLREDNRPAVIVDVGSGITVDLVSADGDFCGGAILPGLRMSARALHEFTDLLPAIDVSDLAEPPPALGTNTVEAMQVGLFWGTVGAVRQLIGQLTVGVNRKPQVFLTGGAGRVVAELLGQDVRHVPNLTLSGIAVTATQHRG